LDTGAALVDHIEPHTSFEPLSGSPAALALYRAPWVELNVGTFQVQPGVNYALEFSIADGSSTDYRFVGNYAKGHFGVNFLGQMNEGTSQVTTNGGVSWTQWGPSDIDLAFFLRIA
jgi:hypothetical protein